MKRKPAPPIEPVISADLLELARKSVESDRLKMTAKCIVCNSECTPNAVEQLCWVCRRLKISAWRDTDQQIPIQE